MNSRKRPRIGVTGPDVGGWPAWMTTAIAIWRAGGHPVRITPRHPACANDELEGLVLGGGADVNPVLYNESPVMPQIRHHMRSDVRRRWQRRQRELLFGTVQREAGLGFTACAVLQAQTALALVRFKFTAFMDFLFVVALWLLRRVLSSPLHHGIPEHAGRDDLEVPLARRSIARGIPVLGICRGMQLINVCLGGTLYQEIAEFYEEQPQLTTLLPRKKIEIEPRSKLRDVLGRTMTRVNSLHHQSVKDLGRDLHVSALEPTGVVQAIEHSGAAYLIGVQWHPEYLAFERSQQNLFHRLVATAIERRRHHISTVEPSSVSRALSEIHSAHPTASRSSFAFDGK